MAGYLGLCHRCKREGYGFLYFLHALGWHFNCNRCAGVREQ